MTSALDNARAVASAALKKIRSLGPCRVAVVGSRSWAEPAWVEGFIRALPAGCVVVSGAARGVDSVAAAAARGCGLAVREFPFESALGRSGGAVRNEKIVKFADVVVVFRAAGESRGSDITARIARSAGKPLFVVAGPALAEQPSLPGF